MSHVYCGQPPGGDGALKAALTTFFWLPLFSRLLSGFLMFTSVTLQPSLMLIYVQSCTMCVHVEGQGAPAPPANLE